MDKRKRRVTYRPSKPAAIMGGVMGIIFVFIGIFMAIPMAGVFGVIWTLFAAAIAGYNLYLAFGGKYVGPEISIEEEGDEHPRATSADTTEERLKKLQALYDQRLISTEEFEEKRKEILKEL